MTGRRTRRARGHHPVVLLVCAVVALTVGRVVLHLIGLAVVAAAIAGAAYLAGQRARPVARATVTRSDPAGTAQLASLGAERDQLAAQVADLTRQLADAREAAHAAWDAAASVPPRKARHATGRAQLLDDPLAGAHELGGPR
jgi:outer membrane murein-binding lipoprotein Lpp